MIHIHTNIVAVSIKLNEAKQFTKILYYLSI